MAITKFIQTLWSKKIKQELATITSLKDHCDFQYEGEIKQAATLKILNVVRPTINTYVPNQDITFEAGTDAETLLEINQFKDFAIQVDDVNKAQSVPGLIQELSREAVLGLNEEGDKYVASLVLANIATLDAVKGQLSAQTDGGIALNESAFTKLYTNNVKPTSEFYLEICPLFHAILRPAIMKIDTDNLELRKKGAIGKYGNAYVTLENLLPTGTVLTQANCTMNILRTSKAIAFAGQLDKVEAVRLERRFADGIKGLYVFGAKIVRPKELCVIGTY